MAARISWLITTGLGDGSIEEIVTAIGSALRQTPAAPPASARRSSGRCQRWSRRAPCSRIDQALRVSSGSAVVELQVEQYHVAWTPL